jgi:hypothetical protein
MSRLPHPIAASANKPRVTDAKRVYGGPPHLLSGAGVGGGVANTNTFIVGRSGSALFLFYFLLELR